MNALSAHVREQAAAHRATFADAPGDRRPLHSAEALELLAGYADAGAEREIFQMRYLLEHHVADGRFAWPDGQSGRAIAHFGYAAPISGEWDLEQFLMDLCDLVKSDAARHIGENEQAFDRADAPALRPERRARAPRARRRPRLAPAHPKTPPGRKRSPQVGDPPDSTTRTVAIGLHVQVNRRRAWLCVRPRVHGLRWG
jgi:hypothetical protein